MICFFLTVKDCASLAEALKSFDHYYLPLRFRSDSRLRNNAFLWACENGFAEMARLLLDAGAALNWDGKLEHHLCVETGAQLRSDFSTHLHPPQCGKGYFDWYSEVGEHATHQGLLQIRDEITVELPRTGLSLAILGGHVPVLRVLFERGSDIEKGLHLAITTSEAPDTPEEYLGPFHLSDTRMSTDIFATWDIQFISVIIRRCRKI